MTVVLALIFLAAIPLNIYVAVRVHRYAWAQPRIPLLVLLSRLVTTLAIVSVILGIASFNAAFVLLTGIRIIPTPLPTLALIGALLLVSGANVLTWGYLRSKGGAV